MFVYQSLAVDKLQQLELFLNSDQHLSLKLLESTLSVSKISHEALD